MDKMGNGNSLSGIEIAVIGMAGRFPGAQNIEEFWSNLKNSVESISFFSNLDLEEAGVSHNLLSDTHYVKAYGFLEGVEYFDAQFFDYRPREAEMMDPQFRILHECTWEALENAGYNPESYKGMIGLYAGVAYNHDWISRVLSRVSNITQSFEVGTLNNRNYLCTRISYKLCLNGPSFTVQTACSTSLVAVHLACQGLIGGECNIALAGGISVSKLEKSGYSYEEGMIVSPEGHCRAFDARAAGTIFGDGVGIVTLKLLENAVVDGDYINAVIKGSAINNDGNRKVGFTAPSTLGEAGVISAALRVAEVKPESIGYVEAHGTGTALGDTVEFEALKRAFNTDKIGFCALGSVKTNVGHMNIAAGVTGFIKTTLALRDSILPPSLHFETPNPKIDLGNSPFYINTKLTEWESEGSPLRAGVSSFGIGGSNAHIILEQASGSYKRSGKTLPSRRFQLILFSAKTETALQKMTENLVDYLKKHPDINISDVAYTLKIGRKVFPYRRMVVCSNIFNAFKALNDCISLEQDTSQKTNEAVSHRRMLVRIDALDTRCAALDSNVEKAHTHHQEEDKRRVVFMFPGLGAQYVNMGLELFQTEPVFRREMIRCFKILDGLLENDIKDMLYPLEGKPESDLGQTEIAQPVILSFEYALARLLIEWGIQPAAMIGYSFGEYVAACIAGVFSLEDVLKLVLFRGKLIRELPPGAMLNVPLPKNEINTLLDKEISIAIDNGPSCVVAGPIDLIDSFNERMKQRKILCMRLPVTHAIHSVMMEPVLKEYEDYVSRLKLKKPRLPFVSNVTGEKIKDGQATSPRYWASHLRETVRFADGIKELMTDPDSIFVEVGPGHELSSLLLRHLGKDRRQPIINLVRHADRELSDVYFLLSKIGLLWLNGVNIDWEGFYSEEKRCRIPLPTYPFERLRYWITRDSVISNDGYSRKSSKSKKMDIADWFYLPQWERSQLLPVYRRELSGDSCWLIFIDDSHFGSRLASKLDQEIGNVVFVYKGTNFRKLTAKKFEINSQQGKDYYILLEELNKTNRAPAVIIHLWSIADDEEEKLDIKTVKSAQDLGLFSLLYLIKAIDKHELAGNISINILTSNLHEVTGEEIVCPQKAPILGLARVISQEYAAVNCRCIDIKIPEGGSIIEQRLIEQLIEEFRSESPDTVVAYRHSYRWLQTYKPIRVEGGKNGNRHLKEAGVYLITGGLGNIGFTLANFLAKTVKANLILTGRTELPSRNSWENCLAGPDLEKGVVEKIYRVLELEKLGASVLYFSADSADFDQMKKVVIQAEEKFGQINGIIHSAAIMAGNLFRSVRDIYRNDFLQHFQSKIYSLLVLEELLGGKELDFCLLISSPASILGGLGHAAYSAANQFVDAFVYRYNRGHSRPWITVNWGDWKFQENGDDINLVNDPLAYLRMTAEEGVETFRRILNSCRVNQVVISAGDLLERIAQWVRFELKAEINHPDRNKLSTCHPRPNFLNPYVPPVNDNEKILCGIWEEYFGIEKVGIEDNFFELGATSLDFIQINRKIKESIGKDIPPLNFFTYPTIGELALNLDQKEQREQSPEEGENRAGKIKSGRQKMLCRTKSKRV